MPKELTKSQQFLKELLEDSLTKSEVLAMVKTMIEQHNKMKKNNDIRMEDIDKLLNKKINQYMNDTSSGLDLSKKELVALIDKEITRISKEHSKKLDEVDVKISEVKDGKDADEEKITKNVFKALSPQIPTMDDFKAYLEKMGEAVANSLEALDEDKLLEMSAIKGLTKALEELKEMKSKATKVVSGPNANAVLSVDISSQANGTNKEFTIPICRRILMVTGTDYPTIYKKDTDYTIGDRKITFTSAVSAPMAGQNLEVLYIK